ncbi:unnamed protein product, partial [Meganyctiphanes norvegica]
DSCSVRQKIRPSFVQTYLYVFVVSSFILFLRANRILDLRGVTSSYIETPGCGASGFSLIFLLAVMIADLIFRSLTRQMMLGILGVPLLLRVSSLVCNLCATLMSFASNSTPV